MPKSDDRAKSPSKNRTRRPARANRKPVKFDFDPWQEANNDALRDPYGEAQSGFVPIGFAPSPRQRELDRINEQLVAKHGIANAAAHRALLDELDEIMRDRPVVDLSPSEWRVPKGATAFKDAKRRYLAPIASSFSRLMQTIDAALNDETVIAALREADPEGKIPEEHQMAGKLAERFAAAASLATGRRPGGNRHNPAWVLRLGETTQEFWAEYMTGSTRPIFVAGEGTAGANPYTRWVIAVYEALVVGGPKNYAMLRTELSRLRAYSGNRRTP